MPTATLLGLSGCSSSGKTTLARLLRRIFPHTLILHADDFYLPEEQLPLRAGFRDWDCAASLEIAGLVNALDYIHAHGRSPPELVSKEDRNEVHESGVSEGVVGRLKEEVRVWMEEKSENKEGKKGRLLLGEDKKLVILDGFLLFSPSVHAIRSRLDIKIFLRAHYAAAKARREKRSGYVTLEGFWTDPPGYVDKVVWPNYVQEHAWMFEGGDVEGEVDAEQVRSVGVDVCPGGGDWGMEEILEWAVKRIRDGLEGRGEGDEGDEGDEGTRGGSD